MKKTLITLSLATISTYTCAEVVLYGEIKAGYSAFSTKNTNNKRSPITNGVEDYGSSIGFRGSENLGNGLKAVWRVENSISILGSGEWGTNDTYIGLESNQLGLMRLGYINNFSDSDMGDIDPWAADGDIAILGLGNFTRLNSRHPSIRYDSPQWNGFNFALGYSSRDNQSNSGLSNQSWVDNSSRDHDTSRYWVGLAYENSGYFTKYQYQNLKKNNGLSHSGKSLNGQTHRVQIGYEQNNVLISTGYQYAKNSLLYTTLKNSTDNINGLQIDEHGNLPGFKTTTQEIAITAGYHIGNFFPIISYAHGWDIKADGIKQNNSKYDQIIIGSQYNFSKRTQGNMQFGGVKQGTGKDSHNQKQNAKTTGVSMGLTHLF